MDYDVLKKWTDKIKDKFRFSGPTESDIYYVDAFQYRVKLGDSIRYIQFDEVCNILIIKLDITSMLVDIQRNFLLSNYKKRKWVKWFTQMAKEMAKKRGNKAVIIQGYESFKKGKEETKLFQKAHFKRVLKGNVRPQVLREWSDGMVYEMDKNYLRQLEKYRKEMQKQIEKKGDLTTRIYHPYFYRRSGEAALSFSFMFEGKERIISLEKKEKELRVYEVSERPVHYIINDRKDVQQATENILEKITQRERIKQIIHPDREEFDRQTRGLSVKIQDAIYHHLRQNLSPKEITIDCIKYPQEYSNIKQKGFQLGGWSIVKCKNTIYIEDENESMHILTEEEAKKKLKQKNEEIIKKIKEKHWNKVEEHIRGLD